MSDAKKAQLETLPDELLLEIFHYMSPKRVCNFKGLNRRIDSILHDVKLSLDLQNERMTEKVLSRFSPSQVIRVEMNVLFYELVRTMQNLRSLTVHCLPYADSQLDQVRRRMNFQSSCMCLLRLANKNTASPVPRTTCDEQYSVIPSYDRIRNCRS